jgi:hypothetical protein
MSLKSDDTVATTFLYIIIILCYVNKLNSSMSNFGNKWWIFDFETDYTQNYFLVISDLHGWQL